jgi:hypothetical protein
MSSVLNPITAEEVDRLVSTAADRTKAWLTLATEAIAEYAAERGTGSAGAFSTPLSRPDLTVTNGQVIAWDDAIAAIKAATDAITTVPARLTALRKAS